MINFKLGGSINRSLLLALAGIALCMFCLIYTFSAHQKITYLGNEALYLQNKNRELDRKERLEKQLEAQLQVSDRDYVQNTLETLDFLEGEVQKHQALLLSDPKNENHIKRLAFLQNSSNKLRFKEQNYQRLKNLQEVDVIQEHPVEMNSEDLKALLAKIENISFASHPPGKNPPDLLVKKFELIRKPLQSKDETYLIQFQLIKRELTHE